MSSPIPPLPSVGDFIAAFERFVVVPPKRRGPSARVVLMPQGDPDVAARIATGECGRLRVSGRALVPYVRVLEAPGAPDVFEQIEQGLLDNLPDGFGRLRLPRYRLVRTFAQARSRERDPGVRARDLRDKCFVERRKTSVLLKLLRAISLADVPGMASWAWQPLRQLFEVLPRWLYGRRQQRLMMGKDGWFRRWAGIPDGRGDFFAQHEEVTGREADALLCALLGDLEDAVRRRRISPWVRRRRSRFVLVVPKAGAARSLTESVVEGFPRAVERTKSTAVALLAVGYQDEREAPQSFATATNTVDSWTPGQSTGRGRSVHVAVPPQDGRTDVEADSWFRSYPEINPGGRTPSAVAPRLEALALAVAGVVVLSLIAYGGMIWFPRAADTRCLGATVPGARSAPPGKTTGRSPKAVYQEALDTIKNQNDIADVAARVNHAMVRTVVYLGVPALADTWKDAIYSGAIPELRGIALAQGEFNGEAARVSDKVRLKVRVEDAGMRFSKAPEVADRLAREIRAEPSGAQQIMGVVGLAQSRPDTLKARDILAAANVPMVGTVATAEAMQRSDLYRQVAPDNRREARIAAAFARHGNLVEISPGRCVPARRAVVVADPEDTYSDNLSTRFVEQIPDARTIWYSAQPGKASERRVPPDDRTEWARTLSDMARIVCGRIKEDRRTVLYWAARQNEFAAFLDEFDGRAECNGRLTVLGGDDLTGVVVDDQKPSKRHPGVRLYYAAHVLPDGYPPNSMGRLFRQQYLDAYGDDDRWSDDGRAPLAWDAMRVLSTAVNTAYQDSHSSLLTRGMVESDLVKGVGGPNGIQGATGILAFANGGKVPVNKRLLILHDTSDGPEVSLECGALDSEEEKTSWGPGGAYDCPRDARDPGRA
ncbi:ABC transporter substrate-binding protein [Streptomyces sp. NPDC037389]|uniref:ABC transporter substrate-binding protein n=1 Tax=Streptomyces sp. NPDC037389 TaxID=3155369 RepID=UPI0033DE75C1